MAPCTWNLSPVYLFIELLNSQFLMFASRFPGNAMFQIKKLYAEKMYTNVSVVGQKVVVLQIIGRLSLKLSNKILKIIFG